MKLYLRAFHGPTDWGWVQSVQPIIRCEDTCGIMAIDLNAGETVGGIIFDNFTNNSVQTHFMISNCMVLKHGFLQEGYDYIFNVMKKKFMYGFIPGDNEKALKFNKHMGWVEKLRLSDAFSDGVDYVVMELTKDKCRYLPDI